MYTIVHVKQADPGVIALRSSTTAIGADMSLLSLPDEVLRIVIFKLNARDALSLSNTCNALREATQGAGFWSAYMEYRKDPEKTGQHAHPSVFPYELLPRELGWTDRELVVLQSRRICAKNSSEQCKLGTEDEFHGQWVCQDGIRRALCGDCHIEECGPQACHPDAWSERRRASFIGALSQEGVPFLGDSLDCLDFLTDRESRTELASTVGDM